MPAVDLRLNTNNPNLEPERSKGADAKGKAMLALRETMKLLSPQYNGVGLIEEAAEQVAHMAQKMSAVTATSTWPELLARSPSQYLQMVLVIDYCISKGRVVGQHDKQTWVECGVSEQSPYELVRHDTPSSCPPEPRAQDIATATIQHQSFTSWQGCVQALREDGTSSTMPFGLIASGSKVG
jgi:hypothetical protein